MLALYNNHLRLVVLNACFTEAQARSISEVVNYSIGTSRGIGDKVSVTFAGAFYRALGFGKSVREAFVSAQAELALTKIPRSRGIELFVQKGLAADDQFPRINIGRAPFRQMPGSIGLLKTETKCELQISVLKTTRETSLVQV